MLDSKTEEALLNGVARLDRECGEKWPFKINVKKLNLVTTKKCVLGQLFGNYYTGCRMLGIRFFKDEISNAFNLMPYPGVAERFALLTERWKEEITDLQNERRPRRRRRQVAKAA